MSGNLSNPKPGHTTGGSGRGARRGGGAGSGRIGCQQNCPPRRRASLAPPKASKTRRLNIPPEARTSEILFKPMGEQNPRLTRGLSPGRGALFLPGCWTVDRRLFVSANPFHAKHVREFKAVPMQGISGNFPRMIRGHDKEKFKVCFTRESPNRRIPRRVAESLGRCIAKSPDRWWPDLRGTGSPDRQVAGSPTYYMFFIFSPASYKPVEYKTRTPKRTYRYISIGAAESWVYLGLMNK